LTVRCPADHDPAMEISFPLPIPPTTHRPETTHRPAIAHLPAIAPRRIVAMVAAIVLVGSFAVATPAGTDGSTFVSVASLSGATRADRVVVSRVGINVPIRDGVLEAPIAEHVAYRYPGTSWPGGHSNMYLYGHARVGTFLNLKLMRVGDIVQVHLATGAWVRYRVTLVRRVPWNDGQWTLDTPSERLTLQTCTSWYTTADKIVVVAVPVA
jgi:LPXTG-site transpeptidase (sortase) family protein